MKSDPDLMTRTPQPSCVIGATVETASTRNYPSVIRTTAVVLGRWGMTPNGLTWISLLPAIAAGFATAAGFFLIGVACFLVSGVCDLLDGSLARATSSGTAYGALLDSTLDRLSDAAPLVGLTVFFAPRGWIVAIPGLTLLSAYTISYIRARADALGAKLPWRSMRRGDRMIMLSIALLLGPVPLPGISFPAVLTLLAVGLMGLLNLWACVTALSAAHSLLGTGAD